MRTYREFFCRPSERSGLLGHLFLQGKSMSKVYISGRITGNENYVKDFENRARQLKSLGYYPVTLRDNLQDGIGETMSTSLKNIVYEYMLTDCKKICA